MPPLIRCKAVRCNTDLRCHHRLELVVGNFQKGKQFSYQNPDIALVDQCEAEIERSSTNTDIGVSQAVQDGITMSLNSVWFDCNDLDQGIESNISNVIVSVGQELSKNIDTEHAESRIGLDIKNREYCFVQNRISNVFRRVGIGRNLGMSIPYSSSRIQITYLR